MRTFESVVIAAMYLPSGDTLGEKRGSAPGRSFTFRVCKSRTEIPLPVDPWLVSDSTIEFPTGVDTCGSLGDKVLKRAAIRRNQVSPPVCAQRPAHENNLLAVR